MKKKGGELAQEITQHTDHAMMQFGDMFKALTGYEPLSWQRRLYDEWFAGDIKPVIDLPTGMGKTNVMAIWFIARSQRAQDDPLRLPTRLVYVVDRRTVVDQATTLAKNIMDGAAKAGLDAPTISTLRGQFADNRDWTRDPSRPAIIIGTVDLIGSGLLFSGYRSSYKRRPLEAGLLGQDSLLILDEAHLSKPFEKLINEICDRGRFQKDRDGKLCGMPMRVVRMSATSGTSGSEKPPFTLQLDANGHLTDEDAKDQIIVERFDSKKTLTTQESKSIPEDIATAAGKIAAKHAGSRIVIFIKSPKDVDAVRKALIKKDKSRETKIAQLTGTMRGLERDELVTPPDKDGQHERRVMQRFLKPNNDPLQSECFLISTSAGEVGFDLNADHMVCDVAPLDSMIQRLGRVNRRGYGDATVILIKEETPADRTAFDKACTAASELLTDGMDAGPKALAEFKHRLTTDQVQAATAPKPVEVELTDILLDNWSMTSIIEPMPGRPPVGDWLRGIADDLPQTTIAWRVELDQPRFADLDLKDIEEWFDTHRVLPHESSSVPTSTAAKWFTDRWDQFDDRQKAEIGNRSIIVDRGGLKLVTVNEVINQLGRKNTDSIRNADLILPASFGGIERGKGLLDPDAPAVLKNEAGQSLEDRNNAAEARQAPADVADVRERYREFVTKTEGAEPEILPIGSGSKPPNPSRFVIELESDDGKRVQLISYVPKRDKPEWGLTKQTLSHHVGSVRRRTDEILSLISTDDVVRRAAQLAADYHDHGKNRERWQRLVDGKATPAGQDWLDATLGKSGGDMKRDPRRYRHEFGSLREFTDALKAGTLLNDAGKPITEDVFDLAMHLIATHHGRGRPYFPKGGFDPDCESRSDDIHTESIRRFARLQRQYGRWHLAWLENLLRCADALASAENDGRNGK